MSLYAIRLYKHGKTFKFYDSYPNAKAVRKDATNLLKDYGKGYHAIILKDSPRPPGHEYGVYRKEYASVEWQEDKVVITLL